MNFERAVRIILELEGVYVNDANDPGGETKYGISKRSYPELNIADLTEQQAIDIYHRDYWQKCRCDSLPNGLDLLVFDAAVNQGVSAAIRMLQAELKVQQDGIWGPVTAGAFQRQGINTVQYAARRMATYGLNPSFARYGLGWSRRLMRVFSAAISI